VPEQRAGAPSDVQADGLRVLDREVGGYRRER
jgi:hypothetical protein